MKKLSVLLILLTIPFLFVFAEEISGDQDKIKLHAFSSERLREIMQNINLSVHDTTNPDLQTETINQNDMADMVEAVEELLFHAELMTSVVLEDQMSETDIVTFRAMATQLYTETLNIQQLAKNYDLRNYDHNLMDAAYHRLYLTCNACHVLFRDNE